MNESSPFFFVHRLLRTEEPDEALARREPALARSEMASSSPNPGLDPAWKFETGRDTIRVRDRGELLASQDGLR